MAQLDDVHSVLRLNYETPKGLISLAPPSVAKPTLCETRRRRLVSDNLPWPGLHPPVKTTPNEKRILLPNIRRQICSLEHWPVIVGLSYTGRERHPDPTPANSSRSRVSWSRAWQEVRTAAHGPIPLLDGCGFRNSNRSRSAAGAAIRSRLLVLLADRLKRIIKEADLAPQVSGRADQVRRVVYTFAVLELKCNSWTILGYFRRPLEHGPAASLRLTRHPA